MPAYSQHKQLVHIRHRVFVFGAEHHPVQHGKNNSIMMHVLQIACLEAGVDNTFSKQKSVVCPPPGCIVPHNCPTATGCTHYYILMFYCGVLDVLLAACVVCASTRCRQDFTAVCAHQLVQLDSAQCGCRSGSCVRSYTQLGATLCGVKAPCGRHYSYSPSWARLLHMLTTALCVCIVHIIYISTL